MVEADFSGDYLNAENAQDGDIIVFVSGGEYETREANGKKFTRLNIEVEINGRKKIYTPSMETGKRLVKAWGNDTEKWIGKKAQIKQVSYKSFGETKIGLEATPVL